MSVGNVEFYAFNGSLSTGEFPLVTGNETPVHTVQNKLYQKGLQISMDIPAFSGIETCNVCKIDGSYYWITAFSERTTANGQYHLTLDYMGPTSLYRTNDTVKGIWHKLPVNTHRYLKDSVTNDRMIESKTWRPSDIEVGWLSIEQSIAHWYQIVGFDTDGNIKKWGGFMSYNKAQNRYIPSVRTHVNWPVSIKDDYYPNLFDLIKNINRYTGLRADGILDFSVSTRCPYDLSYDLSAVDQDPMAVKLTYNGSAVQPTMVYEGNYEKFYLYDLSQLYDIKDQTVTVDLSNVERAIGNLGIKDWNNNIIATLPNKSEIDIHFQTIGDLNGLYTIIECDDLKMAVPEGRLPYLSNSWMDYVAYQMNGDRTSMENAIKYAQYEKETGLISGSVNTAINSVSTGVMTGAIAGNYAGAVAGIASGLAGLGLATWESDRAYRLSEMRARDDYLLSQRMAKLEPQTAYNVGYGTIYGAMNSISPLRISLSMPENVGTSYYNNWTAEFGYPAEGVESVAIRTGFYQGKPLKTTTAPANGMYWDECVKTFIQGFKFVTP